MTLRMTSDDDVLDIDFRLRVIREIGSGENSYRRTEHLKRREVYRANNRQWIAMSLAAEGLSHQTIEGILARTPRHKICGKIVNKKARAYNSGVVRVATTKGGDGAQAMNDGATKQVAQLVHLTDFDGKMRTSDRLRELHKNTMLGILPQISNGNKDEPLFRIVARPLAPFEYDVIEDEFDRERARCVILSDFVEVPLAGTPSTDEIASRHPSMMSMSDGRDGILADSPREQGMGLERRFIWWTAMYTFTTNDKGEIVEGPPENKNPIGKLPFLNNAEGQEGRFWAEGGADLADADILINKMCGDMHYVAYLQGFGQYVVTGQNVNDRINIGPNKAIVINHTVEEPEPKVYTVNANPPLESWLRMIEQGVAMALTTNDLSAGHVAGTLTANNFPSGVAMLIEQSEATTGVEDKQQQYVRMESMAFELMFAWMSELRKTLQLDADFEAVGPVPENTKVSTRFKEAKPVITEGERLATVKTRRELKLISHVEAIMADNPGLTREEAQAKAEEIEREGKAEPADNGDQEGNAKPEEGTGDAANDAPADDEGNAAAAKTLETKPDEALNGAQVSSLLDILTAVLDGKLPKSAAKALIKAAFNMRDELINQVVDPIEIKEPSTTPPVGGFPFNGGKPDANPPASDSGESGSGGKDGDDE